MVRSAANIGIVNPRLNCAYMMPVSEISPEALEYARTDIAGLPGRP